MEKGKDSLQKRLILSFYKTQFMQFTIWWLDFSLGLWWADYSKLLFYFIPQNYTPVTSLFPTCYFSCLLIPERVYWHHQISNRGSVLKISLDLILLLKSLQIQTHTDISYNPLPVFLICESLWMKASDKWIHVNETHLTSLMIFTRRTWQYKLSIWTHFFSWLKSFLSKIFA